MTLIDDLPALTLSAPVNLRDLGGVPVRDASVRPGVAIRADDLALADEDSARSLRDAGLAAVIDLRSPDEAAVTGRGPLGSTTVGYHHLPLLARLDDVPADGETVLTDQATYGALYVQMMERSADRLVQALGVIALAPGAVAFHCSAGQDRTGVLAAALLLALGADHEAIVADYERTGENQDAIRARTHQVLGPLMARLGVDLDASARAATRTEFSGLPMRSLLAHLDATYADPLQPLRDAGLTDGLVTRLRERTLA
ncbi:tyrosine-protein phosphatase [Microbacterium sp. gxy059]|uniref:tyrosine-protein phosphatase n=1 Tax=Microbacterium sp. gxy059 TaxID=2957199 RepID=UPI003D977AF9